MPPSIKQQIETLVERLAKEYPAHDQYDYKVIEIPKKDLITELTSIALSSREEALRKIEIRVSKLPIITFELMNTAANGEVGVNETVYLKDVLSALKFNQHGE